MLNIRRTLYAVWFKSSILDLLYTQYCLKAQYQTYFILSIVERILSNLSWENCKNSKT